MVSLKAKPENAATGKSEVGSTGRAGRLIGDASRRLAGRQRRRDRTADELGVESAGSAGRLIGDASRRLAGGQRRKDTAAEESRRLGPQAGPRGRSETRVEDQPEGSAEGYSSR